MTSPPTAADRTTPAKVWLRWAAAVALVGIAAVALALAVQSRRSNGTFVAGPDDLGHIHDLVLDSDGALLVAAHSGLYRVDGDQEATLVSSARHDLMALAANGDGELLASGHPDLRDPDWRVADKPPFMGLARSRDEGESWEPGELLGEADFHAIAPLNATSLLAAESSGVIWFNEGDQWDRRGELLIEDLAIDPNDDQVVVGLTNQAVLVVSDDQGRTWSEIESAPSLAVLDWPASGEIIGVQLDGTVLSTSEITGRWTTIGSVGAEPEAVLAHDGHLWIAVEGGQIWHQEGDAGLSVLYDPPER